jgi:hypothetical protein
LRKISAKVGNDDDERAKVLNGAAELIAMVEIGSRNKSKLLPSNDQTIKSVENATEMVIEKEILFIYTFLDIDKYSIRCLLSQTTN